MYIQHFDRGFDLHNAVDFSENHTYEEVTLLGCNTGWQARRDGTGNQSFASQRFKGVTISALGAGGYVPAGAVTCFKVGQDCDLYRSHFDQLILFANTAQATGMMTDGVLRSCSGLISLENNKQNATTLNANKVTAVHYLPHAERCENDLFFDIRVNTMGDATHVYGQTLVIDTATPAQNVFLNTSQATGDAGIATFVNPAKLFHPIRSLFWPDGTLVYRERLDQPSTAAAQLELLLRADAGPLRLLDVAGGVSRAAIEGLRYHATSVDASTSVVVDVSNSDHGRITTSQVRTIRRLLDRHPELSREVTLRLNGASGQNITIEHGMSGIAPGERGILCPGGVDLKLGAAVQATIRLRLDNAVTGSEVWRIIAIDTDAGRVYKPFGGGISVAYGESGSNVTLDLRLNTTLVVSPSAMTTITGITNAPENVALMLIFLNSSAKAVTSSTSALKLNGDYTSKQNGTLSLVKSNAIFYELARV